MPAELLTALRTHLIDVGVVRNPEVAGPAPPMWLEPRLGVKAPGEGDGVEIGPDLVVGAFVSGGIPPRRYESWQRQPIVDLQIRARTAVLAHDLDAQIRAELIDRRSWMLGPLHVIESLVWREFQPLGFSEQAFDYVAAYAFQLYDQPAPAEVP
jgi:hypothetical protein